MFLPKILGTIVSGLSQCQHSRYEDAHHLNQFNFYIQSISVFFCYCTFMSSINRASISS